MARKLRALPPASEQLKNTPYSILTPDEPMHPVHKLNLLLERAKDASQAINDPIQYIREHWDKRLPLMWEALLEASVATGDVSEVRDTLTRMTQMSGLAPRSKVEISQGPEPDLSNLSDEEIERLRGVVKDAG